MKHPKRHVNLRSILQRCREHRITLSVENSNFAEQELVWAGYAIRHGGIAMDPAKIEAIAEFPRPTISRDFHRSWG